MEGSPQLSQIVTEPSFLLSLVPLAIGGIYLLFRKMDFLLTEEVLAKKVKFCATSEREAVCTSIESLLNAAIRSATLSSLRGESGSPDVILDFLLTTRRRLQTLDKIDSIKQTAVRFHQILFYTSISGIGFFILTAIFLLLGQASPYVTAAAYSVVAILSSIQIISVVVLRRLATRIMDHEGEYGD